MLNTFDRRARAEELRFARRMRAEALEAARMCARDLAGSAINGARMEAFHAGRCAAFAALAIAKAAA